MFKSPYDTTACKSHRMLETHQQIKELEIAGELPTLGDSMRVRFIPHYNKTMKPFTHPIIVDKNVQTNEQLIVVDVRGVSRLNENGQLIGGGDLDFIKRRVALMDKAWIDNNSSDLLNCGAYPIRFFSRLVSENIGRRMNLTMDSQIRIQVICAYYYVMLFQEDGLIPKNQDVHLKLSGRAARAVGLPLVDFLEITDQIHAARTDERVTVHTLCNWLDTYGNTIRLQKFKPAILFTMLGGIWYGQNNVEVVATSFEHPPTFTAMLYSAITDRGYRKSVMGQIHERMGRKNELADLFVKNIDMLLK